MSNETKINSGAIFKNDNKKEDKHPDYKGEINCNGKEMDVALWLKTSAKGTKFFSVALSEPYVKPNQDTTTSPNVATANAADDLPF